MEIPVCPQCKKNSTTHTVLIQGEIGSFDEAWQDVCEDCSNNVGHPIERQKESI